MFDLDYTLLRPSDQFEAPGYQRTGARFGLRLDPARWPAAQKAAYAAVEARRRESGDAHDVFRAALARAGVEPEAAVMVGDSVEDDVKGALACGCRAILLDRGGRFAGVPLPRIES